MGRYPIWLSEIMRVDFNFCYQDSEGGCRDTLLHTYLGVSLAVEQEAGMPEDRRVWNLVVTALK